MWELGAMDAFTATAESLSNLVVVCLVVVRAAKLRLDEKIIKRCVTPVPGSCISTRYYTVDISALDCFIAVSY